jgi:hypothetical protein
VPARDTGSRQDNLPQGNDSDQTDRLRDTWKNLPAEINFNTIQRVQVFVNENVHKSIETFAISTKKDEKTEPRLAAPRKSI